MRLIQAEVSRVLSRPRPRMCSTIKADLAWQVPGLPHSEEVAGLTGR